MRSSRFQRELNETEILLQDDLGGLYHEGRFLRTLGIGRAVNFQPRPENLWTREAMVTVKSSQKIFTEEEISGLTGICREHLRDLARRKHLGSNVRSAGGATDQAECWMFTNSDLMVLAVLAPRCSH